MTNNKKIENEQEVEAVKLENPNNTLQLAKPEKLEQCEWVFQFDNDEPQIFAWTSEDMTNEEPTVTFTISNTKDAYISFTNKETLKKFKLYARELTDAGKKLREFQTQQSELVKTNIENESTNKED